MNKDAECVASDDVKTALRYRPFMLILASGLLLRLILMFAYFPAVMLMADSPRYARINGMPLFGDFWMPAGYPMFLKVLHALSHQLWFTIAIQHLMGAGIGVLLFLSVRRLGVSRAFACIPAAVPLLSGDHLYLEHLIMADHLLIFLAAAGLYTALRGLVPVVNFAWLGAGSVLLAMAALARSVGIILLPTLILCTAIWARRPLGMLWKAIAAAGLPGMGVFGLYTAAFYFSQGQYLGLTDMSGWNLYSRVAPFADCRKFTPPQGTTVLCEERSPLKRPGPVGYVWDLNSVARRNFQLGPKTGDKLGEFANQVILHQPIDYVRAVAVDLARYVDPSIYAHRPYAGQSRELLSFGWRDPTVEKAVVQAMSKEYRATKVHLRWQDFLAFYQNVFRISGLTICTLLIFSVLGVVKTDSDSRRFGIVLFGLSAFSLYLLPVLTLSYSFRYGVPAETFLVISGVLGAASVWPRPLDNRQR